MSLFKSIKIQDPKTGEIRILSPEEQEAMLEKGIMIDPKLIVKDEEKRNKK